VFTTINRIACIASGRIIIVTIDGHVQATKDRIAYIGGTFTTVVTTVTHIHMVATRMRRTEVPSTEILIVAFSRNIYRSIHTSFSAVAIVMGTLIAIVTHNGSMLTSISGTTSVGST